MKCPKCGFVSFPGLALCNKCGQPFCENTALLDRDPTPPVRRPEAAPAVGHAARSAAAESFLAATSRLSSVREEPSPPFSYPDPSEIPLDLGSSKDTRLNSQPAPADERPLTDKLPAEPTLAWQDELAERVAEFRHRRSGLRGESSPGGTLEFDFEKDEPALRDARRTPELTKEPATSRRRHRRAEPETPWLDSLPLRGSAPSVETGAGPIEAGEWTLEPQAIGPAPEVVFDSPPDADDEWANPQALAVAPLGLRLAAGVTDAAVLVAALIVFAVIFRKVGGTLSPTPFDAVAGLFIAGFLTFVYFALFSALTFQTPGEAWMGLAIRNFEGKTPALSESLWRAFGYIVSSAALMLGFAWILVDSESLGWHDRMSGTCLVVIVA